MDMVPQQQISLQTGVPEKISNISLYTKFLWLNYDMASDSVFSYSYMLAHTKGYALSCAPLYNYNKIPTDLSYGN